MNNKKIIFGLSVFTAVGIIAYWSLVFAGLFPVEEVIPGYKNWFMSFPVADFWIAANSILLAISIRKENVKKSVIFDNCIQYDLSGIICFTLWNKYRSAVSFNSG